MSRYKVLPRRTREGNPEKCPVCRMGWVNLMDINGDDSLLACFACGCVFVSRTVRLEEREGINKQIQQQEKEEKAAKEMYKEPPTEVMKYVPNQKWVVEKPEKEIMAIDDRPPVPEKAPEFKYGRRVFKSAEDLAKHKAKYHKKKAV